MVLRDGHPLFMASKSEIIIFLYLLVLQFVEPLPCKLHKLNFFICFLFVLMQLIQRKYASTKFMFVSPDYCQFYFKSILKYQTKNIMKISHTFVAK